MTTRGFYRHYKGGVYFVLGVGLLHDSEQDIVVYESTQSAVDGVIRLRYRNEWEQLVDPKTGRPLVDLKSGRPRPEAKGGVPRFVRLRDDAVVDIRRPQSFLELRALPKPGRAPKPKRR